MGPCLADAAPEAAPDLPFVKTRYAVARPEAAAIIAATFQGGSMLNLLSENCAGCSGTSALLLGSTRSVLSSRPPVKQNRRDRSFLAKCARGRTLRLSPKSRVA